jgi:hypothetical protein
MVAPVASKQDFYRRLRAGEFDVNDNHRWYDVLQWSADRPWLRADWNVKRTTQLLGQNLFSTYDYCNLPVFAIQSIGKPGGRCDYNVPVTEVVGLVAEWRTPYSISPMLPDDYIVCQGEVWDTVGGLYLHSSSAKVPMRQALKEAPEHRSGLTAKVYLQTVLPSADYEDMMTLLDRYPGHVVEFGVYGCDVGVRKRRMITWEVRAY